MIHPTFRSSNRLSVQSFKDGGNDPKRDYFDKYYMLSVKIKDFNVLINNKQFFEKPIKSKREAYENLVEMSRNKDYTTGYLLDYLYHQIYNKLIDIELSRQTNSIIKQEINFI